ncbi:YciI-like protein [Primorskyibacter aestuariivivens]|uniref:YciI-like protein n=1 Tax=Primorskyibacter aestuariivivens TaxID=1888912 RepID=UPI0022FFDBCE|nr:YciI-like protein [Primorskyibacter aestuariivivens]MDA7427872.1 YciI-like protein [Primorskyibacter aestuariivivens]
MAHFILFYDYIPDYMARRSADRDAHVAYIRPWLERGEILLGGAFANPADGAAIVFSVDDANKVEDFAAADPYVLNGLVTRWYVREWTTVVGRDAAQPIL